MYLGLSPNATRCLFYPFLGSPHGASQSVPLGVLSGRPFPWLDYNNHIQIRLPLPPTSNSAYPNNPKIGRRFLSSEGKAWKDLAAWKMKATREKFERCSITIRLFFPDKRRRDIGNFIKLPIDALMDAGVIVDDNWVVNPELHVYGELDKGDPRVEIEVEPAPL